MVCAKTLYNYIDAMLMKVKNIKFGDKADKIFKSITADNGSEFATLTDTISFKDVYFTHPCSYFERKTKV